MSGTISKRLIDDLHDKAFRDAYVESHVRSGLAFQIRALREARNLSQQELGTLAGGKSQSAIARLENPDYGKFSLTTLLEVASAFDVALLVRLVSFSNLLETISDLSPDALAVASYGHDALCRPAAALDVLPAVTAVARAQVTGRQDAGASLRSLVAEKKPAPEWRRSTIRPEITSEVSRQPVAGSSLGKIAA
ncbi:MAG: helix-turn-helix transcriptional regulator [Terriglobia bacterium]